MANLLKLFAAALVPVLAAGACPNLAQLRSPNVVKGWKPALATGIFYENRYTDLAQAFASCQQMNKAVASDGISMTETYRVLYGDVPFDLPLVYNATGLPLGVSSRSLAGFSELSFPSVVVDFTMDANGTRYDTLTEYLCWEVPLLGFDYVEVRLSTRYASPPSKLLDQMEAQARALGVQWSGNLSQVDFSSCPPWNGSQLSAHADLPVAPLMQKRAKLARLADPVRHMQWSTLPAAIAAARVPPPCDPNANATDLVLPGIRPGKPQLALVFIQGAEVLPSCYASFLTAIQQAVADYNVIVGAPAAPLLNTPDPLTIGSDIQRIVNSMHVQAGLNVSTATFVYAAHSLGGQILQGWLANATAPGHGASALALFGSYLTRQYRAPTDDQPAYFVPTISVVGELDGLARVSRFAEAYWHQQVHAPPINRTEFPVIVVQGMNHGQFGSYIGTPPGLIGIFDLVAETPLDVAQEEAAAVTAAFIQATLASNASSLAALQLAQAESGTFLEPLVNSQLQEASYFLLPPCYDNPPSPACNVGSPWSIWYQQHMSNVAGSNGSSSYEFSINSVDAMHPVDDITPIHLPNITNTCPAPTSTCTLDTSTVTQQSYDTLFSDLDIALYPMTAHETKVCVLTTQWPIAITAREMRVICADQDDKPTKCTVSRWSCKSGLQHHGWHPKLVRGTQHGGFGVGCSQCGNQDGKSVQHQRFTLGYGPR
jgi:hypothetical protein